MATPTRFELHVMLRVQLSDRAFMRRTLMVEAIMEAFAAARGDDVETWALAGLGAGLDAQMCQHNPARLGEVAAERLRTEGAPATIADAVRDRLHGDAGALTPLAAGLVVAEGLADAIVHALGGAPELHALPAKAIARAVVRAAERGDAAAARVLAASDRLALPLDEAAALAHAALLAIRQDVRL